MLGTRRLITAGRLQVIMVIRRSLAAGTVRGQLCMVSHLLGPCQGNCLDIHLRSQDSSLTGGRHRVWFLVVNRQVSGADPG